MNPIQWLSLLLGLVETYAMARTTPGVSTAQANMATLTALSNIVAHVATDPVPAAAPAPAPVAVQQAPGVVTAPAGILAQAAHAMGIGT